MGDDLGSDIDKISGNEEDLSINVVSEEEASGYPVSSHNEKQNGVFQSIERLEGCSVLRESKQGDRVIPYYKNLKLPCPLNFSAHGVCVFCK